MVPVIDNSVTGGFVVEDEEESQESQSYHSTHCEQSSPSQLNHSHCSDGVNLSSDQHKYLETEQKIIRIVTMIELHHISLH